MTRKHHIDDPELVTTPTGEPGATPGQAEGPRDFDEIEPDPIGHTAGQAEGGRDLDDEDTKPSPDVRRS
jgi:hypothetical protein